MNSDDKKSRGAQVVKPIRDVFEGSHVIGSAIVGTGQIFNIMERVEYPESGGIYVHYVGMPYPRKGFPYPEAVQANDILKRITLTMVKSIATKWMVPSLAMLAFIPWKGKLAIIENFLANYIRMGEWVLSGHFLKPERLSNPAKALAMLIEATLLHMRIKDYIVSWCAKIAATAIEYDDAYRYRFQDIMTEADRVALYQRPRREVKRLYKIYMSREKSDQVKATAKAIYILLSTALLVPQIRKSVRFAVSGVGLSQKQWNWLTLDNADRYHILIRGDYDFTGRTLQQREEIFRSVHAVSKCCMKPIKDYETRPSCRKCGRTVMREDIGFDFPPQVEVAPK